MADGVKVTRGTVYTDTEVISDRHVRVTEATYGRSTNVLEIREFVPSLDAEGKDGYGRGILLPRTPRTREALEDLIDGLIAARNEWPA